MQYASEEDLVFWENQLESKQAEEKEENPIHNLLLSNFSMSKRPDRQNILNRQAKLKDEDIIEENEK